MRRLIIRTVVAILLTSLIIVMGSLAGWGFRHSSLWRWYLPWTDFFVFEFVMLSLSIILILILSKGRLKTYGFRFTKKLQLIWIIPIGLVIGAIGTLIGHALKASGSDSLHGFTLFQGVVFLLVIGPITEEILHRGLFQSYLTPLKNYRIIIHKIRLSIPVMSSALIFSLCHLTALRQGADGVGTMIILITAFFAGIAAGYYREKTGSLIPAIIIHSSANAGGFMTFIIIWLFKGSVYPMEPLY